ncbi:MAG: hypothetical protein MUD08_11050 [Cytophagales bacterium]|jgi:hypothetical protein|nr:hypothetical protein [Cytophagales bacterium]
MKSDPKIIGLLLDYLRRHDRQDKPGQKRLKPTPTSQELTQSDFNERHLRLLERQTDLLEKLLEAQQTTNSLMLRLVETFGDFANASRTHMREVEQQFNDIRRRLER